MNTTKAAKLLRMIQAANDYSKEQMAASLGVTERTYRNYLTDPSRMTAGTWWRVERMAMKAGLIQEA